MARWSATREFGYRDVAAVAEYGLDPTTAEVIRASILAPPGYGKVEFARCDGYPRTGFGVLQAVGFVPASGRAFALLAKDGGVGVEWFDAPRSPSGSPTFEEARSEAEAVYA